jgi:1-acyl-sn-glycerol-3-phosphate acyltransferase
MNALRSILLYLVWIVTVLPWAIAAMLASIFIRGVQLFWFCAAWMKVSLPAARLIMGINLRATGQENIPQGPVVFLVKHQSALETLMLPSYARQPLSYVFKRELMYLPFFGWTLFRMDMIHIDRKKGSTSYARIVRQGRKFLSQGYGVVMFPEGTRTARGQSGHYKSGGARLAALAGVPIVPVAVASARCWPKGLVKRPGIVDISFGPPIDSVGKKADDLIKQVADWIETEMRRIDPDAYPPQDVIEDKVPVQTRVLEEAHNG